VRPVTTEMDRLRAAFGEFTARVSRGGQPLPNVDDLRAELGELTASVTSRDDTVTVVAGPGGAITRISLSSMAMRQSSAELEATLMATLRQAVAEAARGEAAIVERHTGGGLRLVDDVMRTQAAALGTSVETLRSAVERAESDQTGAVVEDEDYSQRSIRTDTGGAAPPGATAGDEFLRGLFARGEE
jgi:YbaB/EbfC DNA-binding family protein